MVLGNIIAIGSVLLALLIIYTKAIRRYSIYKQKRNERKRRQEEAYINKGNTKP